MNRNGNGEQHWYPCPYIYWPICCFSTLFSWNRMAYQGSILPYTLVKPTLAFCQGSVPATGTDLHKANPDFFWTWSQVIISWFLTSTANSGILHGTHLSWWWFQPERKPDRKPITERVFLTATVKWSPRAARGCGHLPCQSGIWPMKMAFPVKFFSCYHYCGGKNSA